MPIYTVIKVDSDIPLPERAHCRTKETLYPFNTIEVGQSFLIRHPSYVAYANRRYAPKKFAVRKVKDASAWPQHRVWRVE